MIQIHLLFLFIIKTINFAKSVTSFKYISCSYLSSSGWITFTRCADSNTSLVLIYHQNNQFCKVGYIIQIHLMFLFILLEKLGIHLGLTFKYISCSYLSVVAKTICIMAKPFKYISCSYLSNTQSRNVYGMADSNTSHVLIYPDAYERVKRLSTIQIHLMFLFIEYRGPMVKTSKLIQIHLMFLFIRIQ